MTFRRILILTGILLVLFLSMFTWNSKTKVLDDIASNFGLELTGVVLNSVAQVQDFFADSWARYVALSNVHEENEKLKARVRELETRLLAHREDLVELRRLRELLKLPVDVSWKPVGARILAGHLGPNSLLDSITINRGYVNGAKPGVPVVTHKGLIGRVLRSSPHTSTVLMLTNNGSRIAVFTQESRTAGVLTGTGSGNQLEVRYMHRATTAKPGEILVTSGLDGKYPKGIPVAKIVSIMPSNYTEFMTIFAEPLVDLHHIEEVLLLEPTGVVRPSEPATPGVELVGPPLPDFLRSDDE